MLAVSEDFFDGTGGRTFLSAATTECSTALRISRTPFPLHPAADKNVRQECPRAGSVAATPRCAWHPRTTLVVGAGVKCIDPFFVLWPPRLLPGSYSRPLNFRLVLRLRRGDFLPGWRAPGLPGRAS